MKIKKILKMLKIFQTFAKVQCISNQFKLFLQKLILKFKLKLLTPTLNKKKILKQQTKKKLKVFS